MDRLAQLQQNVMSKELNGCTFEPAINQSVMGPHRVIAQLLGTTTFDDLI
jgi:hypothetical protein